jgi:hypothetical protein
VAKKKRWPDLPPTKGVRPGGDFADVNSARCLRRRSQHHVALSAGDELEDEIVADAVNVVVTPELIQALCCEGWVAAIGNRYRAIGPVELDLIWRAVDDIHVAAIGLPTRFVTGGEMLVCVGDAALMLVLTFIVAGARLGIAALQNASMN